MSRALSPAWVDRLIAAAIALEVALESAVAPGVADWRRAIAVVAAIALAAPVAVRRRWPGPALVVCAAIPALQAPLGGDLDHNSGIAMIVALIVLAYGAGAWLELRAALISVVVAAAAFVAFIAQSSSTASGGAGTALFFAALVFAAPWLLGRLMRQRGRRADAFAALAVQADAEREQRERAAIAEERVRIGRELQDIIAHSVSAMVIGAGGARRLLTADPAQARASILTVEQTGREALADLRRMLGVLRKDEDPRALAPQPGLGQLDELLGAVGARGLRCELHREGEPIDLTPGVDLVGYRLVEAALESALRHDGRHATVTVTYALDALALDVAGDGTPPDIAPELDAMAQRVALYDGRLDIDAAGDGFSLRARLPLAAGAVVA